jgi:PST family polysaccharide transporter
MSQESAVGKQRKEKKERFGKKAKVGAVWSLTRQGVNELVHIPTSFIMARLLTPQEFGISAAATFFLMLANRLSQLGFNTALVRQKELRPEHASSVFLVNLAVGVFAWAVLTLSAESVGVFFRSPETGSALRIAALSFLILPFGTVPGAILQRDMKFKEVAYCDWVDTLSFSFTSLLLAWMGFGYWSLIYGRLASAVANASAKAYLSTWRPKWTFSWAAVRELLSYGLGIQTKRLLEYSSLNLDTLIVGRTLGITTLGLYDKAFSTVGRIVHRMIVGPNVSFRIFAVIQEDLERLRRAYAKVVVTATILCVPILGFCIAVAPQLFLVLYGRQWLPAVVPFQILCISGMLKVPTAFAGRANEASGRIWLQARQQLVHVILLVPGVYVGSRWGIGGAAFGVLFASAVLTVLTHALLRHTTGFGWGALLGQLVPATACTAVVMVSASLTGALMGGFGHAPAPVLLLVQGAVASVCYLAFVLFSPFRDVREIVQETVSDLTPGLARRFRWLAAPTQ